jgi:hypothetical protein
MMVGNFNRGNFLALRFQGKLIFLLTALTSFVFSTAWNKARALNLKEEVSVQKVFTSPTGYDDNDNIQLVIDGELPGLCFERDETTFKINHSAKTIEVHQMMKKRMITDCLKEQRDWPEYFQWPVSYTTEINLGTLDEGTYKIIWWDQIERAGEKIKLEREFRVKKSDSSSIDEFLYAPVSSAFIGDLIYESSNADVVLSGIWNNGCQELYDENIEVIKEEDVYVILPKMTNLNHIPCERMMRPLQKIVKLGPMTTGRYLLHIRSITGHSINKVFTVIKGPFDPRMNR